MASEYRGLCHEILFGIFWKMFLHLKSWDQCRTSKNFWWKLSTISKIALLCPYVLKCKLPIQTNEPVFPKQALFGKYLTCSVQGVEMLTLLLVTVPRAWGEIERLEITNNSVPHFIKPSLRKQEIMNQIMLECPTWIHISVPLLLDRRTTYGRQNTVLE